MGVFKLGGMTLKSLFKKPETLLYPLETKEPPAGLKGHIVIDVDTCILCSMCAKSCPADAIEVDKPNRTWSVNQLRCIQCGYCVQVCPKACLAMDPAYSPAVLTKDVTVIAIPEQEKAKPAAE